MSPDTLIRWALLAASAALAGCQQPVAGGLPPAVAAVPVPASAAWRALASDADEDRLARLDAAWSEGLADAKPRYGKTIAGERALLRADGGLAQPDPTPGSYQCRLIELGKVGKGDKVYEAFKPFFCYILLEGDRLSFVKQTGSQRPAGLLYEDDNPNRMIFLGSMASGASEKQLAYGDDPKRDLVGVVERVAPFRWRLVLPWPQDDAKVAVYELTPTPNQPDER